MWRCHTSQLIISGSIRLWWPGSFFWEKRLLRQVLDLQPPDQVRAWLGVLSTQAVFNEPADLKILYLSRHWFGPGKPHSPGRLHTGCAASPHCDPPRASWLSARGHIRWYITEEWSNLDVNTSSILKLSFSQRIVVYMSFCLVSAQMLIVHFFSMSWRKL